MFNHKTGDAVEAAPPQSMISAKQRNPDPASTPWKATSPMNTITQTRRVRQGFTLIELLTVIAIIGILAAIIIPTVGTVRKTANEAKNLSNLRQIALTLNTLANDNKDKFPDSGNYNDPVTGNYVDHWKTPVGAYLFNNNTNWVQSDGVFVSPTAGNPVDPILTKKPCHYSLNSALTDARAMSSKGGVIKRSRVSRPSQVILVADGSQVDTSGMNAAETFHNPAQWQAGANDTSVLTDFIPAAQANNVDASAGRGYLRYRNRDKVQAGMVDGSARTFKMGTVTYGNIIAAR
ncbi:MAG: prepilin-type N-terminal cleavage/methylation domain-containing protein [Burkholderiales bacterium]|nr:prepilin-type N-terminal cleavage/methylation domain-containing protein [Opitutaceae bacterium]